MDTSPRSCRSWGGGGSPKLALILAVQYIVCLHHGIFLDVIFFKVCVVQGSCMRKVQDHIKIMHSKSASIIDGVECRMQGPPPVKRARDSHISQSVTVAVHVLLDVEVVV